MLNLENEKELLLKGIEKLGSKYALSKALGYKHPYSNVITRALKGEFQLPKWRMEHLQIILKKE